MVPVLVLARRAGGVIGGRSKALFTSSSSTRADSASFVKSTVTKNKTVVFSKSYCPYCEDIKEALSEWEMDPVVYELDLMPDGADIQKSIFKLTGGHRTVPSVWVDGEHVGGATDTMNAYKSGKLQGLL